jgi:hypothetical protein
MIVVGGRNASDVPPYPVQAHLITGIAQFFNVCPNGKVRLRIAGSDVGR